MSNEFQHFFAVILAGGKGERFWPLSTSRHPKQVLALVGDKPLIQQAVDRLQDFIPADRVYIITSEDLAEAIRRAAPELPPENVVGEPVGRDTAAAIALGAVLIQARDPEGVFCVLTADHVMGNLEVFTSTLREGLALAARQEVLVTIGIPPTEPSSAYGYIEAGTSLGAGGPVEFLRAQRFVEKPARETAEAYLKGGRHYWNSGMFLWSVRTFCAGLEKHCPPLAEMMRRLAAVGGGEAFATAVGREYAQLKKISIDYALMEKADNIVMAVGQFAWDDVGSWPALENHLPKDTSGNALRGDCEALDSSGNIVLSEGRLTALIGVKDLVVVQAEGVTLVCPKDRAQDVKKMVERLRADGRREQVL